MLGNSWLIQPAYCDGGDVGTTDVAIIKWICESLYTLLLHDGLETRDWVIATDHRKGQHTSNNENNLL